MGQRGPARKPVELRLAEGDRGHFSKHRHAVPPKLDGAVIMPRRLLGNEGRRFWKRITETLQKLGVLGQQHQLILEQWALDYEMSIEITKAQRRAVAGGAPADSLYDKRLNVIRTRLLRYAQEFGLTPSTAGAIAEMESRKTGTGIDKYREANLKAANE